MQPDVSLRPYTPADAAQVVEVINADAAQTIRIRRAVVDSAGNVRLLRYMPLASRRVVATNPSNEIVGYAYHANRDSAIVSEVGGAVHPRYQGQGIGTRLVAWAEQQAHVLAEQIPSGVKTVLQSNVFEDEPAAIRLLAKQEFTRAREWIHVQIELDAPPAVPAIPAAMHIREMDLENDWERVGPAMDEAYADHWGAISLPSLNIEPPGDELPDADVPEDTSYSNSPGHCFILMTGDTVVGGIFSNAKLVERDDAGRVGSMFVRPHYRRRGLGRALMFTAFKAFWDCGVRRIILDTDANSLTDAPSFYTGVGMQVYRREYLYEKEIRPGREVRRLSM